jgi:fermentation-respiration switch protein FrsA (DUF1100 family)
VKRKITFDRDGLILVGNLFTPDNFREKGRYGAVIVEGSLTSVKEQMPGTYAQKLADQGFVALAFDYSHYGESAGEPRQLESPAEKLRDLQAAVSYLRGLPYVQAVGTVGICTSAGNAACLGAADPRVRARKKSQEGLLKAPLRRGFLLPGLKRSHAAAGVRARNEARGLRAERWQRRPPHHRNRRPPPRRRR